MRNSNIASTALLYQNRTELEQFIQEYCLPARRENKAQTLPVAHELSFHIEVLSENSH